MKPYDIVSCPVNSHSFSAILKVCDKARSAGNGKSIAKVRNAGTGLENRALRESAESCELTGQGTKPVEKRPAMPVATRFVQIPLAAGR